MSETVTVTTDLWNQTHLHVQLLVHLHLQLHEQLRIVSVLMLDVPFRVLVLLASTLVATQSAQLAAVGNVITILLPS